MTAHAADAKVQARKPIWKLEEENSSIGDTSHPTPKHPLIGGTLSPYIPSSPVGRITRTHLHLLTPLHPSHYTMTTIPSRLAQVTTVSRTLPEARKRSLQAYRAWWRSAPEIVSIYALAVSPSMVRLKIRADFERNRHIENLDVINMLLHKNQQEYQETMNLWKQEPHVLHWFKPYEDPAPPATFLDKFYSGRDDPAQVVTAQRSTG